MGEAQNQPFQFSFNPRLKVEFQGSRVTSDGGLILVRELDERLGFSALIAQHLTDPRRTNTQFPLADLVRQSVYRRLAGYEDVNDAERLSHDPTFRLISSKTIWERGAALTSRVHSFETEVLTQEENLAGLPAINRELIARVEALECSRRVVLDLVRIPVNPIVYFGVKPITWSDKCRSPIPDHSDHSVWPIILTPARAPDRMSLTRSPPGST